eukprot:3809842-Pyramimonas_sp.AAC.1
MALGPGRHEAPPLLESGRRCSQRRPRRRHGPHGSGGHMEGGRRDSGRSSGNMCQSTHRRQ